MEICLRQKHPIIFVFSYPNFLSLFDDDKGQIISECPYEIIVWTKIPTKKLPRFLPKPLRRGQIKKFIKPIMLISIIRGYLT